MTGCRENILTAFQDSLQAIGVIGAILGGIEVIFRETMPSMKPNVVGMIIPD